MALASGARLGSYEIVDLLGAGGMGEVYRARDHKLGREVAIKVLPAGVASDPDRLARLEREARLLAALNHPNIATIHGLEELGGTRFLVLELIEGLTLADRLLTGPLGVDSALRIGVQIAAALEGAHEKGVVHRDLKPANVKVTPEGHVKVLDFGLAKSIAVSGGTGPTQTVAHSAVGVVTGTAPYMSPEQARGEPTGRQTDIWSFGVILYEMLTTISPFQRDTTTGTLARVLEAQPDFAELPADTPPSVQRLVRRCLEKDPKRRFRDVGDIRIELEDALSGLTAEPTRASGVGEPRRSAWRSVGTVFAVAAALAVVAVGSWLVSVPNSGKSSGAIVRLSIAALPPGAFAPNGTTHLALSPDGTRFAYAASTGLSIRELAETDGVKLDDTGMNPFFSPDGAWLVYRRLDTGLEKVPAAGGGAVTVVQSTERLAGGTWCAGGTIVYAATSGLYRVDVAGGAPQPLLKPDAARQEREFAWPHCLPDGRAALFTVLPLGSGEPRIAWLDLETLERHDLLDRGSSPQYVPTGHLLYAVGEELTAIAFDARSRELRSAPVVVSDVRIATAPDNGAADYAVSANGTLAFIAPGVAQPRPRAVLEWVDRAGNAEPLGLDPGYYAYPRVSPDATRIAIDIGAGRNRDIWIWDVRLRSLTRLTDGPTEDMLPLWSPDGRRVFFASNRRVANNFDIYSQAADGATPARVEYEDPKFQGPNSFSPDGKKLVINEEFRALSVLDLTRGTVEPLLQRDAIDWHGAVSPDGHWLAYESNESGAQFEIYVRPFPDVTGQREKVSVDGGRYVSWDPRGSGELYYVDLGGAMMAVPIKTAPALEVGRPVKLFDFMPPGRGGVSGLVYDVSPKDGRFLRARNIADGTANAVNVSFVLNWFEALRAQVPAH
jgi:serine/threonine protein kinase